MAIPPTDIRILFTNYDIIAYFLNLASCSEHFISIKHRILATFNKKKFNSYSLYAFKVIDNSSLNKSSKTGLRATSLLSLKNHFTFWVTRNRLSMINTSYDSLDSLHLYNEGLLFSIITDTIKGDSDLSKSILYHLANGTMAMLLYLRNQNR
jgi:hypothetical protein